MRIDPVLALALSFGSGALLSLAPIPGLLAAACILSLLARRLALRVCILCAAVTAFGAYRAQTALGDYEARWATARDTLTTLERCSGRARVESSPTRRGDTLSFAVVFDAVECETKAFREPTRVKLYGGPGDLVRGDVVDVVAQLGPVRLFRNAELADPRPGAARAGVLLSGGVLALERLSRGHGLSAIVDRARAHARERIDESFPPAAAPLARALVLGESDLDPEDAAAFRASGLSHLLAVSGTHLVFAVVALVRALRALLARFEWLAARCDVGRGAAAAGAVLSLLYADFAGGSGSAWRAAWMLCAAFAARALGRRACASRSVAASVLVGAVVDPLVAFDVSFLLSLAATAGLLVLSRPLSRRVRRVKNRVLAFLAEAVTTTVSAMIPCIPLTSLLGPSVTIAGIFANVVAAPFGEIIALPLCLFHPLTFAAPALERGIAAVAAGALLVIERLAHASAAATWLAIPVPPPGVWHFAVLAVAATGWLLAGKSFRRSWLVAGAVALVLSELAAVRAGSPKDILRVTALDVGQGDSTLIDLPDGSLMLVDAGGFVGTPVDPGERVVAPLLRWRRRQRVDVAVLSHPHPDHFGGLAAALAGVEVGELWDTGQGRLEGAGPVYKSLLATWSARGVPVLGPAELCGAPRRFGAALVRVLSPCPAFVPGLDANDNSFVIRVELGRKAALLTGDAERHEEGLLLAADRTLLRADFLKVGHHGSRTSSTPEFIDAVRPRIATISAGVRNRFGHPHAETLSTLDRAGVSALRLDHTGSVEWSTDGSRERTRIHGFANAGAAPRFSWP